jgi:hypothetical protein
MSPEQEHRLHFLSAGPCAAGEYIAAYYGLAWPLIKETASALDHYRSNSRRPVTCAEGQWTRYEIEGFMTRSDVLPKKWMGAKLGLTVLALERLLAKLDAFGMQRSRYELGAEFIADSLSEDLVRHVPGMRFRTFGDHNAYCERLHTELGKAGIQIEQKDRLFCATSTKLEEYPRRFAMHFDCLTLEPLSTKHSVWLDFRKPLNLPPDRCSKLFYVENREQLKPFVAGTSEPDNLGQYEQFLGAAKNA